MDKHYPVTVGLHGDPSLSLDALAAAVPTRFDPHQVDAAIRGLAAEELDRGGTSGCVVLGCGNRGGYTGISFASADQLPAVTATAP